MLAQYNEFNIFTFRIGRIKGLLDG